MKTNKMKNVSKYVQGKFFTLERKAKNKTQRYCAKMITESPQYMTVCDVSTSNIIKIKKDTITNISCGSFSL